MLGLLDIDKFEGQVRKCLTRLASRSAVNWTPDSIIEEIRQGRLTLIGNDDGFMVVQFKRCVFFIIIASAFDCMGKDFMRRYWAEVMRIAANVGAKTVEWLSDRDAYRRLAPKFGFKIGMTRYIYEVQNERR